MDATRPTLQPPIVAPIEPGLLQEVWGKKGYLVKAAVIAIVFWLLEFALQFYILIPGELKGALLRSFALSGATLIGVAVIVGPLAFLKPQWNFVEYRRTFGVAGFSFAILHVLTVMTVFFNFDVQAVFFDANPYKNPLVFGALAFVLFLPLYVTSTDWAVSKLGFRNWKAVHRLVYLAFIFSALHYAQINPSLLYNPAGYLLIAVTVVAMALELASFALKVKAGKAGKGAYIGAALTIVAIALFAIAFFFKSAVGA